MTINELIEKLNKFEDKEMEVILSIELQKDQDYLDESPLMCMLQNVDGGRFQRLYLKGSLLE